jgi:S1-C subfamily serine protease
MGGLFGVFGVMVAFWLMLPALADVPGWASQQARGSELAQAIDDVAPRPPDTLQALRRLVGENDFPRVFDALRPAPVAGPPPEAIPIPLAVQQAVAASTVKVEGEACNRIQEGSGFAADVDTVVTNAHVVAGVRDPKVRVGTRNLSAKVVYYNSDTDIAVLEVDIDGPVIHFDDTGKAKQAAVVLGYPNDGPFDAQPARIRAEQRLRSPVIFGRGTVTRVVFSLRGLVRPGNSGGPLVSMDGQVLGVIFAASVSDKDTGYALTAEQVSGAAARGISASTRVSSGKCA